MPKRITHWRGSDQQHHAVEKPHNALAFSLLFSFCPSSFFLKGNLS